MSNDRPPPTSPGSGDYPGSGQPDATGSGYPTYPADAHDPGNQPTAAKGPQPSSIRTAVRLMWAGAALSALSLVVTLATLGSLKDQIREQLAEQDTKVTEDAVNASYTAGIAFAVILGILGILLWLLMAWKNGQGPQLGPQRRHDPRRLERPSHARRARDRWHDGDVVRRDATGASSGAISTLISILTLVVSVAVVVLLWRKESSEYYARH